jgi:hypothetical protein
LIITKHLIRGGKPKFWSLIEKVSRKEERRGEKPLFLFSSFSLFLPGIHIIFNINTYMDIFKAQIWFGDLINTY